ncbi:MAG: hypothetical protein ACK4OI_14335 [Rhizobium oryzihabitans]
MLRNLLGRGPEKNAELPDVRSTYDATIFNGRGLIDKPTSDIGHLINLQVQTEVARLDTKERLDTLIEIQRELLETQKAILEALRRPERS